MSRETVRDRVHQALIPHPVFVDQREQERRRGAAGGWVWWCGCHVALAAGPFPDEPSAWKSAAGHQAEIVARALDIERRYSAPPPSESELAEMDPHRCAADWAEVGGL